MARSRIAAMGACCLLALAATVGGAAAQTAGGPLPLLQIDHAKTVGKPAVHARHKAAARIARSKSIERAAARRIARRVRPRTRVADAARDLPAPPPAPPQTTPRNESQNVWPTPAGAVTDNATAPSGSSFPGGVPPGAATEDPTGTVVTESVVDTDPNGILNGGHAVPAALPAQAASAASAPTPQPAEQPAAASRPAPVKVAAAASVAPKPAVRAMLFKLSPSGPVGSASWLAHVLAALGGAIAAGAVAWLLIRPAPERTYS
jgi:hypothetical protein